jgi:hypothetical protein
VTSVRACVQGSKEFQQIKLRAEELDELGKLVNKYCPVRDARARCPPRRSRAD